MSPYGLEDPDIEVMAHVSVGRQAPRRERLDRARAGERRSNTTHVQTTRKITNETSEVRCSSM